MNVMRALAIFCLPLVLVMGCASGSEKTDMAEMPSGSITIENWAIQAIATMNVGKGELNYNGKVYTFNISGVGAGGVGVAKVNASGQVHNLDKIDDFPGKYFEVKASATVVVGKGGIAMENDKGVLIKLTSDNKGLQLSAGPKGITIAME